MSNQTSSLAIATANAEQRQIAKHYTYTPEQEDLIKRTVSSTPLTNDEFQVFMYVAKARNLDPLQRQIHCVKRKTWDSTLNDGRGGYTERMTIQTGIDGYRAIANRTGLYMPSDREAKIEGESTPNFRVTMYVKKWSSNDRQWHEVNATAYYREFVQLYKPKDSSKLVPNSMWEKMPVNQLTKCAEALALRKGWPEELGDLRTDEEMAQADNPVQGEVLPPAEQKKVETAKAKQNREKDLATLSRSNEPNRGHGNEGMAAASKEQKPRVFDLDNLPEKHVRGMMEIEKFTARTKRDTKQPYLVLDCVAGDARNPLSVYVWHTSLHGAVTKALHVPVEAILRQSDRNGEEVWALEGFVKINGAPTNLEGVIQDVELNAAIDSKVAEMGQQDDEKF